MLKKQSLYLEYALRADNLSLRTLIYGYDFERNTVHIYIDENYNFNYLKYKVNGEAREGTLLLPSSKGADPTLEYKDDNIIEAIVDVSELELSYISSLKRLFTETCDFEFCKLIEEKGVKLPYGTFIKERTKFLLYGKYFGDKPQDNIEIKYKIKEFIEKKCNDNEFIKSLDTYYSRNKCILNQNDNGLPFEIFFDLSLLEEAVKELKIDKKDLSNLQIKQLDKLKDLKEIVEEENPLPVKVVEESQSSAKTQKRKM